MAIGLTRVILLVIAIISASQVAAFESVQEPPSALALETSAQKDRFTLMVGPFVYHTHHGHHNDLPWLTGLEWQPAGYPVEFGAAYFRNSFYQDSVYVYVGKRWPLSDDYQGLFFNLTGGLLYGYRGEYEDKVPFNHNGFALAVIPGLGYQYRAFNAQFAVLGSAGFVITFGFDFPR
jgi:hypothetical protein